MAGDRRHGPRQRLVQSPRPVRRGRWKAARTMEIEMDWAKQRLSSVSPFVCWDRWDGFGSRTTDRMARRRVTKARMAGSLPFFGPCRKTPSPHWGAEAAMADFAAARRAMV